MTDAMPSADLLLIDEMSGNFAEYMARDPSPTEQAQIIQARALVRIADSLRELVFIKRKQWENRT